MRRVKQAQRRALETMLRRLSRETFASCGAAPCYGVPFNPEDVERKTDQELAQEVLRLRRALGRND
jgi:hypothetical protein